MRIRLRFHSNIDRKDISFPEDEFTAARIARQAGVSVVLLYRLVGTEFKALRAQSPGSRRLRDEELQHLRQENAELRKQVREAREKLRTTAVSELTEAMLLMERYEQENLQLRDEIKLLRQRLNEGGQVIVTLPQRKQDFRLKKLLATHKAFLQYGFFATMASNSPR